MKIVGLIAVLGLAGCASTSDRVAPTYTPPARFSGLSCAQMETEGRAIQRELITLGIAQDQQASNDRSAFLTGMFVTWPALLVIHGNGNAPALARIKGELAAWRQASIDAGCITPAELADPRFAYVPPPLPKVDEVGQGRRRFPN